MTPINFIDAFLSVTVQPWRNFAISAGIDVLWRYSTQDAFYQLPEAPLVPGSANSKRFLGAQSNWQGNRSSLPMRRFRCSARDWIGPRSV